jgi:hypothetical protein
MADADKLYAGKLKLGAALFFDVSFVVHNSAAAI